jgi:hypothetical protein
VKIDMDMMRHQIWMPKSVVLWKAEALDDIKGGCQLRVCYTRCDASFIVRARPHACYPRDHNLEDSLRLGNTVEVLM